MKIRNTLIMGAASALALTFAASASASITPSFLGTGVLTSSLGYTTQDFSAPVGPYAGYSLNATTAVGSVGGVTADPPPADTNRYLSVAGSGVQGPPLVPGATTVTFTTPGSVANNYFGLYWGSIDTYNTLRFFNGATQVYEYTGTQALMAIDGSASDTGNQTSDATNRYFEFNFTGSDAYTSIQFISTQNAFESDNHTIRVPEPGTLALFGAGLVGMWMAVRRRKVVPTSGMSLA